jgi:uncharacterized protein (DUF885 family)
LLALSERARRELGPKFDIRAFHDQVLTAGAPPLDVLEACVQASIREVSAAGGPNAPAAR